MENNTNGGEEYYTPNISEFHVGFEYEEYIDGRNEFIKKTISLRNLYEALKSAFEGNHSFAKCVANL